MTARTQKRATPATSFAFGSLATISAAGGVLPTCLFTALVQKPTKPGDGTKPPRQIISDMKWEGETWMPAEDMSSSARLPESFEFGGQDKIAETSLLGEAVPAMTNSQTRPRRPPDPIEERDDTPRSKDKDFVPSRFTYVWDEKSAEWVLRERPRIPIAGRFFAFSPVPVKQIQLLKWILNHAKNPINEDFLRNELVPRLNRTHTVSLRLLDWLVVDFSRERNVAYRYFVPLLNREVTIVVHQLYESLRYRWRRRRFDCFRRRHRVYFDLDGQTYSTTVAQLHFFFMSRMYGFLDYAMQHLDEIEGHMKKVLSATTLAKQTAKAKKVKCRRKALVQKAQSRVFISDSEYKLSLNPRVVHMPSLKM